MFLVKSCEKYIARFLIVKRLSRLEPKKLADKGNIFAQHSSRGANIYFLPESKGHVAADDRKKHDKGVSLGK